MPSQRPFSIGGISRLKEKHRRTVQRWLKWAGLDVVASLIEEKLSITTGVDTLLILEAFQRLPADAPCDALRIGQ